MGWLQARTIKKRIENQRKDIQYSKFSVRLNIYLAYQAQRQIEGRIVSKSFCQSSSNPSYRFSLEHQAFFYPPEDANSLGWTQPPSEADEGMYFKKICFD